MKEFLYKPEIVVFAGPNGSGKSTFTELLKPPMEYSNADEIKKNMNAFLQHVKIGMKKILNY